MSKSYFPGKISVRHFARGREIRENSGEATTVGTFYLTELIYPFGNFIVILSLTPLSPPNPEKFHKINI